jgi:hypothetical protein
LIVVKNADSRVVNDSPVRLKRSPAIVYILVAKEISTIQRAKVVNRFLADELTCSEYPTDLDGTGTTCEPE